MAVFDCSEDSCYNNPFTFSSNEDTSSYLSPKKYNKPYATLPPSRPPSWISSASSNTSSFLSSEVTSFSSSGSDLLPRDVLITTTPFTPWELQPFILTHIGFYYHESSSLKDPFFAHSALAKSIADDIIDNFGVVTLLPDTTSLVIQQPTLPIYIAQLIVILNHPYSYIHSTLSLLSLMKSALQSHKITLDKFSGQRIFTMGYIIASRRLLHPNSFAREHDSGFWSSITHFSIGEIEAMIALVAILLPEELEGYELDLVKVENPYGFLRALVPLEEENEEVAILFDRNCETANFRSSGIDIENLKANTTAWGASVGEKLRKLFNTH